MPYQETASDLERKWLHSHCWYGNDLVYVGSFVSAESPNDPISGTFTRADGTSQVYHELEPSLFAPVIFPNGLYNVPLELQQDIDPRYRTGCWKYSRNPRRSPMRGITRETHRWTCMGQRFIPNEMFLHWSFNLLDVVINPKYVNYHQVFEAVKTSKIVAIARGWAVGLSPQKATDGRHLFMSMYGFCGWAYPDQLVIHHRGSHQEALDFVQRSRLNIPVIYATE